MKRFPAVPRLIPLSAAALAAMSLAGCVASESDGDGQRNPALRSVQAVQLTDTSNSPLGKYLAGRVARAGRDSPAAAEFYSQALAADPDNAVLLRRTVVLKLAEGNFDEARNLADRTIKVAFDAPLARTLLAIEAFRSGKYVSARDHLSKMKRTDFSGLLGPIMSAWVDVAEGRYDDALEDMQALSNRRAFRIFKLFHEALINDLAGRDDDAKKAYDQTAEAGGGNVTRVLLSHGAFLSRSGGRDDAIARFATHLEKYNNNSTISHGLDVLQSGGMLDRPVQTATDGLAEAFFGAAGALGRGRSGESGRVYAYLALRLKPNFDPTKLLLAEMYVRAKRWQDAIRLYRTVSETSPLKWTAELGVADALADLEKTDDAIAHLQKMAAQRKDDIRALNTIGDILGGEERYEEAIDAYSKAIARIAKPATAHWPLYFSRGIVLEKSKRWDPAEKDFLMALKLKPDQPRVLNYLGYSWVEQGRNLKTARGMLEKAVEQRPNDGYIVDSLGWALYRLDDYAGAVKHLERAVELVPEDPILNDHLGDAYWRVGRRFEARFQWRHALTFKPQENEIPRIREKLSRGLAPKPKKQTNG